MRKYVRIKLTDEAAKRSIARFSKFCGQTHRIEVVKNKVNETLTGDGFYPGDPMTYFGFDVFKNEVWSRAWECWIPDSHFIIIEKYEE